MRTINVYNTGAPAETTPIGAWSTASKQSFQAKVSVSWEQVSFTVPYSTFIMNADYFEIPEISARYRIISIDEIGHDAQTVRITGVYDAIASKVTMSSYTGSWVRLPSRVGGVTGLSVTPYEPSVAERVATQRLPLIGGTQVYFWCLIATVGGQVGQDSGLSMYCGFTGYNHQNNSTGQMMSPSGAYVDMFQAGMYPTDAFGIPSTAVIGMYVSDKCPFNYTRSGVIFSIPGAENLGTTNIGYSYHFNLNNTSAVEVPYSTLSMFATDNESLTSTIDLYASGTGKLAELIPTNGEVQVTYKTYVDIGGIYTVYTHKGNSWCVREGVLPVLSDAMRDYAITLMDIDKRETQRQQNNGIIQSVMGVIGSLGSGNVGGAISGAVNGGLNYMNIKEQQILKEKYLDAQSSSIMASGGMDYFFYTAGVNPNLNSGLRRWSNYEATAFNTYIRNHGYPGPYNGTMSLVNDVFVQGQIGHGVRGVAGTKLTEAFASGFIPRLVS